MSYDTGKLIMHLSHLKKRKEELSDEILKNATTEDHQVFLNLLREQREVSLSIQKIKIKLENIRLRKPINGINTNPNISEK
jgi:hypothetical protein